VTCQAKRTARAKSLAGQTFTKSGLYRSAGYFGCTVEFPPGLPGGGMTGIFPEFSGVGARIWGSTPEGGHNTPLDFASLSPRASPDWPTVAPEPVPFGAQSTVFGDGGGAVACGGVAGAGGACAAAAVAAAHNTQQRNHEFIVGIRMERERMARASVPAKARGIVTICGSGSARNVPSAASADARRG
jgi:hypothetical protein